MDNNQIIAKYDGKEYSISDYTKMVKNAIDNGEDASELLRMHSNNLKAAGVDYAPSGGWLDQWLVFLARNGETSWAIDELYRIRSLKGKKEEAIWALELGTSIIEEQGSLAPSHYYLVINNYYYEKLDELSYDSPQYKNCIDKIVASYNHGIKAGCDPDVLDGAGFANTYANKKTEKGGCYIATAVYGSYDCPQVWTLRRYRDEHLLSTFTGSLFVKFYYAVSPTLVKWFGRAEWFNKFGKKHLNHIVKHLQAKGYDNTPYYGG